jgi:hypothetical protein
VSALEKAPIEITHGTGETIIGMNESADESGVTGETLKRAGSATKVVVLGHKLTQGLQFTDD